MDQQELRDLFTRGFPAVVRRIGGSLRAHTDPEDLVQEALLRAWRRELDGAGADSLAAWVTTTAANLGRSGFRRDRAEERALVLVAAGATEAVRDSSDRVAEAVARLPARQCDIVLLHYYGDYDVDTIARLLGISVGTVKSTLHRARRSLHDALGDARRPVTEHHPTSTGETMKGWHMAGTHPDEYAHGVVEGDSRDGRPVAYLESTAETASGFGTLMQTIDARWFLGKRMRLSGSVRTRDVDGWVGLWLRVDGPHGRSTAFDNMQDRALKGSTEWGTYEVVLDVATDSVDIAFGTILSGTGRAELSSFSLEEVGSDVAVTGRRSPEAPQNMDFSE